ncbi:RHS repeat-associated core domain-containing protein [Lysinibacillus sp. FSL M8-0355]
MENSVENASQTDADIADNLATWVFNDSFVPSAKITNKGSYSIISDYLGTPVEAYDEQGHKVWSAELDVYGRVKEFTGEKDFIQFRYQGQYEDVEIGLYYNRFRYYDPEQGNYTQVDPIGLAGGNPTLYGYVGNPNNSIDTFGLAPKFPMLPGVNLSELNLIMYKPTKVTPINGSYYQGIERAWELEKDLVGKTGHGTHPWNEAEIEELKSRGKVSGYTGHHITNHKNGALGNAWKGDPRNIRFLPNAKHGGGYNKHLYGERGHRGSYTNATTGRLIDRQAMIDRYNSEGSCKKR